MENEIKDVMASLDKMPETFQQQVKRLREFRDRMKDAGAVVANEQFAVPLMERLETPREWTVSGFQSDR